jgi:hypothetical protein
MNVATLRDLAADIGNLLRLVDRLEPIVAAYARHKAPGAPKEREAVPVASKPAPASPHAATPARRAAMGQAKPNAARRACAACGEPFTPSPRGGIRQKFCGGPCRTRAMLSRRKAKAVGGSSEGEGATPASARPRTTSPSSGQRRRSAVPFQRRPAPTAQVRSSVRSVFQ